MVLVTNKEDCGCPEGRVRDAEGRCVMPEVTFSGFIMSLAGTALYHMGEAPHPQTGHRDKDLELAKHSIDTLAMLEEKTRGNLEDEERQLLANVLYDLKLRFVKARE